MRKRYNTPHRSRVVKTRMTEEEYAKFAERLYAYNMSQAEFIRQAITGAAIRPIITVSPVNDELLAAVGKLTAEYGSSRVVKTRMTEEEYAKFAERLYAYNMSQAEFIRQAITGAAIRPIITVSPVNDELLAAVGKLTAEYGRIGGYNMSQAEFIRQAITGAAIRPIITVSPVNDELLAAVGKLTAEYGRIGGNLNQIARTLNEWHSPYPQLAGEVRATVSDLAALKFEVLQKVGDAVGNTQTYQF